MSQRSFIFGLAALALAAGPAFAQATPGATQPRHVTHPAPEHKMHAAKAATGTPHPDQSADQLNAKELASIQSGAPAAPPAPAPAPAKP